MRAYLTLFSRVQNLGVIDLEGVVALSITIAGAGSVGLLLGSYLVESGLEVTMFVKREGQANLLIKEGIRRINVDGSESVFRVHATTDITKTFSTRLWIIAVKYADLQGLLVELKDRKIKEPMMFVQNGIGHVALANGTDSSDIAYATVEHGAHKTDDRTVRHNGVGVLTIGAGRGNMNAFKLVEKAQSRDFPVMSHGDAEHILMRKVLINCMINPLTAILEVTNGELLTNHSCNELFKSLYEELMNAFPEMRSVLPFKAVSTVCQNTAKNQSSMLVDRSAGRPMEIETIVTAVIEKAHAARKKVPLLTTFEKMLYAIEGKGNIR